MFRWLFILGITMSIAFAENTPREIPGLKDIVSIAAANNQSLAVDREGRTYRWGTDWNSQRRPVPEIVKVPPLKKVVLHYHYALGLSDSGEVYFWGRPHYYVPPGFRYLPQRFFNRLTGKEEPNREVPLKVAELSGIVDIRVPELPGYEVSATATDKNGNIWGWVKTDLSNAIFEWVSPTFKPPFVWKKLSETQRDKFHFSYDEEITLNKAGTLTVTKGAEDFRSKNLPTKKGNGGTLVLDLPLVRDVKQVSIHEASYSLAFLFEDGRLGLLTQLEFKMVDTDVSLIETADTRYLLVLKMSGELFLEGWGSRKLLQKFPESEVAQIAEMAAGENHFLIRMKDGTVRAWGNNDQHQLGIK